MSEPFIDERGVIEDILEECVDAITRIATVAGAVRGNHVHRKTTQWTYVFTGQLRMMTGKVESLLGPGQMIEHKPGVPHAWKAVVDTDCFVFTRGPRSGEGYETDTDRLEDPLIV